MFWCLHCYYTRVVFLLKVLKTIFIHGKFESVQIYHEMNILFNKFWVSHLDLFLIIQHEKSLKWLYHCLLSHSTPGNPASVKEKTLLKLWIIFQTLPCVLEKVLPIPILICENLMYNKGRQRWYFITFKKFWHIYFEIIWPQSRNGIYWLTYWQIKYHGSRFMFDLCHNQSCEKTRSDALTLKVYCHLFWRKCVWRGGEITI